MTTLALEEKGSTSVVTTGRQVADRQYSGSGQTSPKGAVIVSCAGESGGTFGPASTLTAVLESPPQGMVGDFIARAVVAAIYSLFSISLLQDLSRTHHLTGVLLLAGESIVVALVIFRRPARLVDRSPGAAVVTAVSFLGPQLLRAGAAPGLAPDVVTAIVSSLGLMIAIAGKLTLGRSFGLVPANRGIVFTGPYKLARHPIYSGYLLTHLGFIVAHPTAWNVGVIVCADGALIIRALMEERLLQADEGYRAYCRRVAWHLVPGVF
jgi:protein-S-isoprenylcysteine O-methyltransferase Ste14